MLGKKVLTYRPLPSTFPLFKKHQLLVRTIFSYLPCTFSLTSGWKYQCVDALNKLKPVKYIWLT